MTTQPTRFDSLDAAHEYIDELESTLAHIGKLARGEDTDEIIQLTDDLNRDPFGFEYGAVIE